MILLSSLVNQNLISIIIKNRFNHRWNGLDIGSHCIKNIFTHNNMTQLDCVCFDFSILPSLILFATVNQIRSLLTFINQSIKLPMKCHHSNNISISQNFYGQMNFPFHHTTCKHNIYSNQAKFLWLLFLLLHAKFIYSKRSDFGGER